jgi:hypothetical protein
METSEPLEEKEIEEIIKDEKFQRALNENSISAQQGMPVVLLKEAPYLGITAIIFLVCGVMYFLLGWE